MENKEILNPCDDCGKEIGNPIFTVCSNCWDKHFHKRENKLYTPEEVQKLLDDQKRICYDRLVMIDIDRNSKAKWGKIILNAPYPESFKTDKEIKIDSKPLSPDNPFPGTNTNQKLGFWGNNTENK